jgi:leucyl aminopeptidase (aminopeptidase T)
MVMAENRRLEDALKSIFTVNLGAVPGERVLVFTDTIPDGLAIDKVERSRREGLVRIARAAADAGRRLGIDVLYTDFPALGSHGMEPDARLWRLAFGDGATSELDTTGILARLREKKTVAEDARRARDIVERFKSEAVDAIIALSNHSTSHTRFRDLLTSVAGVRYASMPLFEENMLWGSMSADWDAVEKRSLSVASMVEGAARARITTPDGTDISFSIEGRTPMLDTGMLKKPGSFSNLPAGEVYLAPVEGTAEGVLVLNWAPNRKLDSQVYVKVEKGRAQDVSGDEPFVAEFIGNLDRFPDNRNLAELGIGTNDRASRPDNVLESEKILGTIHIAFGDNSSMGGKVSTPFHQDFVFFGPTLTVEKNGSTFTVINAGRLAV